MYSCKHITSALSVLEYWSFFSEALKSLIQFSREKHDNEYYLKILCYLATCEDKGFVAIVFDDNQPVGFGALEDITPYLQNQRIFLCRVFWHNNQHAGATIALMNKFEQWAKLHGVSEYLVTTERNSGAAIRCFKSEKYGFKRSFTQFVKSLT